MRDSKCGFTLLEFLTAVVIILVLFSLAIPSVNNLREKARSIQCGSNLKNLFVATNSYIQDNQRWPQIIGFPINSKEFAEGWLAELLPYSVGKKNWLCPTIIAETHYPEGEAFHLDYIPTPFGSNRINPFLWPSHPWFSERGSVHGNGNLVILTNGSVKALNDITGSTQATP